MGKNDKNTVEVEDIISECHESLPLPTSAYQQIEKGLVFNKTDFPILMTDSNVKVRIVDNKILEARESQRRHVRECVDKEIQSRHLAKFALMKSEETQIKSSGKLKKNKRSFSTVRKEYQSDDIHDINLVPMSSTPQRKRVTSISSSPKTNTPKTSYAYPQSALTPAVISQPLYSWIPLRLGRELGTAAYNNFMKKDEQYNAEDMLQLLETMRARTIIPPRNSFLEKVTLEGNPSNKSFRYLKDLALESRLSKLYEFMCTQDSDDGIAFRRINMCMSALACSEKLASLENETFDLHHREQNILEKSKSIREKLSEWKGEAGQKSNSSNHSDEENFNVDDEVDDPSNNNSFQTTAIRLENTFSSK